MLIYKITNARTIEMAQELMKDKEITQKKALEVGIDTKRNHLISHAIHLDFLDWLVEIAIDNMDGAEKIEVQNFTSHMEYGERSYEFHLKDSIPYLLYRCAPRRA